MACRDNPLPLPLVRATLVTLSDSAAMARPLNLAMGSGRADWVS